MIRSNLYTILSVAILFFISCSSPSDKDNQGSGNIRSQECPLLCKLDSIDLVLRQCDSDTLTDMEISAEGGEKIIYSSFSTPIHMRIVAYGETGQRVTTFLNYKEAKVVGFDQMYTYDLPLYEEGSEIVDSVLTYFEVVNDKMGYINCERFKNGQRQEECFADSAARPDLLEHYNYCRKE